MPPLTSSRFKRPARGLFATAVVVVGALGGPVGPVEAGASAGPVASISGPLVNHIGSATSLTPLVTDALGTHAGAALTPIGKPGDPVAGRAGACDASLYGSAFNTSLGSTWTSLAIRTKPCTSASSVGAYGSGTIGVQKETSGETICRGRTSGDASSIWFKTSKGYIWSGGTSNPRWNKSC